MKSLRPDFWLLKRIVSAGFLAVVAGFYLSAPTSAIFAGGLSGPPAWYPFEMEAINLYLSGINQESSDPAAAVKTLLQARQDSSNAISDGGGGNTAVLHNDELIARALMTAQSDAARAPENKDSTENQQSGSNNSVGSRSSHVQPTSAHTTVQQVARSSVH